VELVSKLDEFGKFGWIALAVLGFWLRWPIGLAIILFLVFSGRIRQWRYERRGQWYNMQQQQNGGGWGPWAGMGKWGCGGGARGGYNAAPSGNKAFDEYRAETLRRLEEEQQEFQAYLERLRQARDKAEFDQFMAERRNRNVTNGQTETV
jgi:hypothetical protein